jgi:[CysO sulfur-carrier protein]-S-L-cysteine hydrolase
VQIPDAAVEDMFSHAREEAPRECCGLLIGTGDVVTRTVRAANIDPSSARYLIDPTDQFNAIRLARVDGLEVIGAYHSHVASAATPSPTDIAEARNGPDFLYLIVSLSDGEVGAYRVENGRPIALQVRNRRARGPARSAS